VPAEIKIIWDARFDRYTLAVNPDLGLRLKKDDEGIPLSRELRKSRRCEHSG
jgi:hypothetical protein